jgi:large subunit ribosomal protein L13
MDMNKAFFLKKEDRKPRWLLIDAAGQIVGRLATQIADKLRGKDKAIYTPHDDAGDYVVVINAEKIVFTGNKMEGKVYEKYTGWVGNKKFFTPKQLMDKDATRILEMAVKGMLPKTKLARQIFKKLRVYKGAEHPHQAQLTGFAPEK